MHDQPTSPRTNQASDALLSADEREQPKNNIESFPIAIRCASLAVAGSFLKDDNNIEGNLLFLGLIGIAISTTVEKFTEIDRCWEVIKNVSFLTACGGIFVKPQPYNVDSVTLGVVADVFWAAHLISSFLQSIRNSVLSLNPDVSRDDNGYCKRGWDLFNWFSGMVATGFMYADAAQNFKSNPMVFGAPVFFSLAFLAGTPAQVKDAVKCAVRPCSKLWYPTSIAQQTIREALPSAGHSPV